MKKPAKVRKRGYKPTEDSSRGTRMWAEWTRTAIAQAVSLLVGLTPRLKELR